MDLQVRILGAGSNVIAGIRRVPWGESLLAVVAKTITANVS